MSEQKVKNLLSELLLAVAEEAGLVLVDKAEHERLMCGIKPWLPMDSAPRNGVVVDLCARLSFATAGMPQYGWFDEAQGHWRGGQRHGDWIVPWAWRPRDETWPHEESMRL